MEKVQSFSETEGFSIQPFNCKSIYSISLYSSGYYSSLNAYKKILNDFLSISRNALSNLETCLMRSKSSLCIQCDHWYFFAVFSNKLCPRDEINYKILYAPVLTSEIIYYFFSHYTIHPKESWMCLSFCLNIISEWELIRLNVFLREYLDILQMMHDNFFQEVFRSLSEFGLSIRKSTIQMKGNRFSFSGKWGREIIKE